MRISTILPKSPTRPLPLSTAQTSGPRPPPPSRRHTHPPPAPSSRTAPTLAYTPHPPQPAPRSPSPFLPQPGQAAPRRTPAVARVDQEGPQTLSKHVLKRVEEVRHDIDGCEEPERIERAEEGIEEFGEGRVGREHGRGNVGRMLAGLDRRRRGPDSGKPFRWFEDRLCLGGGCDSGGESREGVGCMRVDARPDGGGEEVAEEGTEVHADAGECGRAVGELSEEGGEGGWDEWEVGSEDGEEVRGECVGGVCRQELAEVRRRRFGVVRGRFLDEEDRGILGDDVVHALSPDIDVFAEVPSNVVSLFFSNVSGFLAIVRGCGEDEGLDVATRAVQCGPETGLASAQEGGGDLGVRVKDGHAPEEVDDFPERGELSGGLVEGGEEGEEHVRVGEVDLGLQGPGDGRGRAG